MGATDFQAFLGLLGRTCFIYTVTAVTGLLDRTVPGCQEDRSPIPSSGHCLPSHPHCYVNQGKALQICWDLWSPGSQEPLILLICSCSCFQHSPSLYAPENHPYVSSFSNDCSSSSTFASLFVATVSLIISLCFSYSIICPMSLPYHLLFSLSSPLFSFTSIHLSTFAASHTSRLPFSFHSPWFSTQTRSHFIPFHTCVTGNLSSVPLSFKVLFQILSWLLLSSPGFRTHHKQC